MAIFIFEFTKLPAYKVYRVEHIGQLNTVGADVLYRCRTCETRYQGQVFQTGQTLFQAPYHQLMPILACTKDLENKGLRHIWTRPLKQVLIRVLKGLRHICLCSVLNQWQCEQWVSLF